MTLLTWNSSRYCMAAFAVLISSFGAKSWAQSANQSSPQTTHLSSAKFKIPFNIEMLGGDLDEVQLWVSTDVGETWQMHGTANPSERLFDFKAAAEGMYLFSVQTIDKAGNAFPSPSPPLRVYIDTSKPNANIRADLNAAGQLLVELEVVDDHLEPETAILRMRTDRDPLWRDLEVGTLTQSQGVFVGKAIVDLPACREVALAFTVRDRANNTGEATYTFVMPRTASGGRDMTLASSAGGPQKSKIPDLGANQRWEPHPTTRRDDSQPSASPNTQQIGPGKLAGKREPNLELELDAPQGNREKPPTTTEAEELPLPFAVERESLPKPTSPERDPLELNTQSQLGGGSGTDGIVDNNNTPEQAFHCKSRAFSLDYSVEALGGKSLSEVELWGTEDAGQTWRRWGSDPDRTSPFDVQVGLDGLFGFRMVIIAGNGLVSNRPQQGDNADVWINVDTAVPTTKITRAVYGEGSVEGMLVLDYTCRDEHLVKRPITLSYSERPGGPWTDFATGLENSGTYSWQASPNLPNKIYVRLQCVDKAGNVGVHRLDVPIDTRGLGPRGRIQGFRPILESN